MANLDNPFSRIANADNRGRLGTRAVYGWGTTNLSSLYADSALSTPLMNPVAAIAGGFLPAIYIAAGRYKVVDRDEDGATIQENTDYTVPDLAGLDSFSFPVVGKSADFTVTSADYGKIFEVDATGGAVTVTMDSSDNGNGMPCFVVKKDASGNSVILSAGAGETFNGGSSTYSLTQQNQCAGVASQGAAGWRMFLIPAPTEVPIRPQGRLTLTTGVPVLASDVSAATTLYYTAFEGNYVPIWDGTSWTKRKFAADLSLALDSNSGHTGYHQALKAFDVFVADDDGTLRFGTGPAWSVAGNYVSAGTLTTGTAARGTGAGTTELERTQGLYVNKNAMTLRFGSAAGNTVSIAAGKATYLGTIWIDATDGQVSCHVSSGQNRKWGVWNAYNRVLTTLIAVDTSNQWAYTTNTTRPANNTAANAVSTLCGLPDERVEYSYSVFLQQSQAAGYSAVGYNSTTTPSGLRGWGGSTTATAAEVTATSLYVAVPAIGLNAGIALENGGGGTGTVWSVTGAGEGAMRMSAKWMA